MADHTNYNKPGDDTLFLERLREGSLMVDLGTGDVFTKKSHAPGAFGHWHQMQPAADKAGYLFIRCRHKGTRKAIAVNRLVYMAACGGLIPEGFDIDHIDHNKTRNAFVNLRLRGASENRADNNGYHEDDEF